MLPRSLRVSRVWQRGLRPLRVAQARDVRIRIAAACSRLYRLCARARTAGGPKTESAGQRRAVTGAQASSHPNALEANGADFVGTAEDSQLSAKLHAVSGFLSMNQKRQQVGLGRAVTADARIVWPNGEPRTLTAVFANPSPVVRQGVGGGSLNTDAAPAASDS